MRDRPSTHGAIVGEAVAQIAESVPGGLDNCCATCAFRRGCMTNQMASTVLVAYKCAVGVDPAVFACHHGMENGEPTKVCAGWLASKLAEFETVKEVSGRMVAALQALDEDGPDPIREAFDAWVSEVDPDGKLDDYRRGRLYLKSPLAQSSEAPTPMIDRAEGERSASLPPAELNTNLPHESKSPDHG